MFAVTSSQGGSKASLASKYSKPTQLNDPTHLLVPICNIKSQLLINSKSFSLQFIGNMSRCRT